VRFVPKEEDLVTATGLIPFLSSSEQHQSTEETCTSGHWC